MNDDERNPEPAHPRDEYERFKDLLRRLAKVSKQDVDEQEAKEKEAAKKAPSDTEKPDEDRA